MPQNTQLIKLIMTFLREQRLYKSLLILELETQTSLDSYTKELHFLRMEILDGHFQIAEQYIQPLKQRLGDNFNYLMLELKKQQYFELINSKPDVEVLITLLKSIEQLTTQEVYKNLCYFLTLPSIKEHPEYRDWSVEKGRLDCFDKIAQILRILGKTFKCDHYNSLTISQVLDRYIGYQNAFNLQFEEEHDLVKEQKDTRLNIEERLSKTVIAEEQKSKIFHNRNRSGELENQSNQFYQASKKYKEDKNIIIEKLHISDINHEDQELEQSVLQVSQIKQAPQNNSNYNNNNSNQYTNNNNNNNNNNSTLFNYKYDDMVQVAYLTDTHPIRSAVFSSDGEMFAIGTNSKSLRIYSMKQVIEGNNSEIQMQYEKTNHHSGSIYCIDWSRSGKFIATGSNDKLVKIYCPDEDIDLTFSGHKGLVRSVCFVDENKLLSAGQDALIKVWDVETQKCIRNLEGHTQAIYCVQTAGDGSFQVSVGMDRTMRIWDQRMGRATGVLNMQNEINYISLSESATNQNLQNLVKGSRRSLQFQNQGLAALAHSDGSISIWNLLQQKCVKNLKYHNLDCRCVEFDPTSRYLVSASFDSTLAIYDLELQQLVSQIEDHTDRVVLCKWHPFYPFVLSTSADQTGRIFAPEGFLSQLIKSFNVAQ